MQCWATTSDQMVSGSRVCIGGCHYCSPGGHCGVRGHERLDTGHWEREKLVSDSRQMVGSCWHLSRQGTTEGEVV